MMGTLKNALGQLEARLQTLVEGSTARLFPGGEASRQLVGGLLQAMQDGVRPGEDGVPTAPNQYQLLVSPENAERLRQNQPFLDELARLIVQACQEAELRLAGPLALTVEGYHALQAGEVRVAARNSLQDVTPTIGMAVAADPAGEPFPTHAFLIVDGVNVFPLELPVINIGRRPDNQLVIDDGRISRLHAQLRLVRGRFVIFDLDSTGGTFVNGSRIHQQILYPGDVISLAGVPLIFGQEGVEPDDTQKVPVKSS